MESFEKMGTNLIEKDNFIAATAVTTSLAFRGEKMFAKQLQTTGRIFSVAMDKNGKKSFHSMLQFCH